MALEAMIGDSDRLEGSDSEEAGWQSPSDDSESDGGVASHELANEGRKKGPGRNSGKRAREDSTGDDDVLS